MAKLINETKVITNEGRLSYVNVWEPKAAEGSTDEQYSLAFLIPKEDTETIGLIEKAIENAKQNGKSKWGGKIPGGLKNPLRDGDIEKPEKEEYAGMMFLNARNKTQPQVVGPDLKQIVNDDSLDSGVYSGCYGRISVAFYAYNNVSKGVGASLQNVQKLRNGEPFGAERAAAVDDFGDGAADFEDDML